MIKGECSAEWLVLVVGEKEEEEKEVMVEFKILYSRISSFSSFVAAYTFRHFSTWRCLEVV